MITVAKGWPHRRPLLWSACHTVGSQDRNLGLITQSGWDAASRWLCLDTLLTCWLWHQQECSHSTKWATWWLRRCSSARGPNRVQVGSGLRAGSRQEARVLRPWSGEHSTPRMKLRALWRSSDSAFLHALYHPNHPSHPHQKREYL